MRKPDKKLLYVILRRWLPPVVAGGVCITGVFAVERAMFRQVKAKRDKKIKRIFGDPEKTLQKVDPKSFGMVLDRMHSVPDKYLSPEHKFKRSMIKARVYRKLAREFPDQVNERWALSKARKECVAAREKADSSEEKARLYHEFAKCSILEKDWKEALRWIDRALNLDPSARRQRRLKKSKAECLRNIGEGEKALRHLNSLLEEDIEQDSSKIEVLLQKGDILCGQVVGGSYLRDFLSSDERKKESADKGAVPGEETEKEAEKCYTQVLDLAGHTDAEQQGEALLGLIRLNAAQRNRKAAYKWFEKFSSGRYAEQKIMKAYSLIARMEEELNRPARGAYVLEMAIQRSEQRSECIPQYWQLFRLRYETQQYEDALQTLCELGEYVQDIDDVLKIVEYLMPEEDDHNPILSTIAAQKKNPRKRNENKLYDLLAVLWKAKKPSWVEVRARLLFLRGYIPYGVQRYQKADERLSFYLEEVEDGAKRENMEKAYFYKVMIGEELDDIPKVVTGVRARTYLNRFPSGSHHRKVRQILCEVYRELQMYEAATEIAKGVFLDDMIYAAQRSGEAEPESRSWVESLGTAAICYMKSGKIEQADRLFDMFMEVASPENARDEILLAWVRTASELGQPREAERRSTIALHHLESEQMKRQVRLARYVRKLQQADGIQARKTALEKLRGFVKEYEFQDYERARETYKAIQSALFSMGELRRAGEVLQRMASEQTLQSEFVENWYMKWLNRLLETGTSNDVVLDSITEMLPEPYSKESGEAYDEYGTYLGTQLSSLEMVVQIEELIQRMETGSA